MAITITKILELDEYIEVFPQDSAVEEDIIQGAINNATITLDTICGGMITKVWSITDPEDPLYRTDTEHNYIKQAVAKQSQYLVSKNLDMSAGSESYTSGSNSYNETRPRPELVVDETIYQLLAQARVYNPNITTDTTIAKTGATSDFYDPTYDPGNEYITYNVGDNRYIKKNSEYTDKFLYSNSDGNIEYSEIKLSPTGTSSATANFITINGVEWALGAGAGSAIWGRIEGTLSDQQDLQQVIDSFTQEITNLNNKFADYYTAEQCDNKFFLESEGVAMDLRLETVENSYITKDVNNLTNYYTSTRTDELLANKQDIINKYADSASVSDNTLTINFSNGDTTSFTPTSQPGGITDVQVTDTQGTASVVTAGVATIDLTGYATTTNVNEQLANEVNRATARENEIEAKINIDTLLKSINGYDATKIQQLYNNQGTIVWSEDTPHWWNDVSSLTTADIGTTREVEVNGVTHTVRLIGVDHDDLADGSGKAHTTWEFVNLISDSNGYSLATFWKNTNDTSSANFDYLNSDIRKAIDGQGSGTANWFEKSATTWSTTYANKSVLDMLPSDLVSKLKTVSKIVNEKTSGSWVETTYSTNLFLLSPLEMGYSNQYAETTVTTYDYYVGKTEVTDASRIKQQVKGTDGALTSSTQVTSGAYTGTKYSYAGYNSPTSGEGGIYWLRSPYTNNASRAWDVYSYGYVSSSDFVCYRAYGVSPCFCL